MSVVAPDEPLAATAVAVAVSTMTIVSVPEDKGSTVLPMSTERTEGVGDNIVPCILSTALANGAMAAAMDEVIMLTKSAFAEEGGAILEAAGVMVDPATPPDRTEPGRGKDG